MMPPLNRRKRKEPNRYWAAVQLVGLVIAMCVFVVCDLIHGLLFGTAKDDEGGGQP